MRVAVVGANGQLGNDVVAAFRAAGDQVACLDHDRVEIEREESIRPALERASPDLVVNCAAMHHLDRCEEDPRTAFAVNTLGALHVARFSKESGCLLMHVSTDYVFDGARRTPYVEDDPARPLNAYGITKLAGEHWIGATTDRHVIVRTSGLYGLAPCRAKGRSFAELMLKLAIERGRVRVVDDEVLTPTYALDVARAMVRLARCGKYGVFHVTAEGECSWHAFARKVFDLARCDVVLEVADPGEFPAKTPRPKYSVLENARMKAEELGTLPPWEDGLARFLQARSKGLRQAV